MIKKIIKKLYKRYFPREDAFFIEQKKYSKDEEKHIQTECKLMLDVGILQKVVDMMIAESETLQLYSASNQPVQVTEAELYRQRRGGIEDLMKKIKYFSSQAVEPKEVIDKYSIT